VQKLRSLFDRRLHCRALRRSPLNRGMDRRYGAESGGPGIQGATSGVDDSLHVERHSNDEETEGEGFKPSVPQMGYSGFRDRG
jgi:hypothetical protein